MAVFSYHPSYQPRARKGKYSRVWFVLVDFTAEPGKRFNDLIDLEDQPAQKFKGAWARVIIKADAIREVIEITELGLKELGFKVVFIDTVQNAATPIEKQEVEPEMVAEVNWLLKSDYVFKISDRIYPYARG